METLVVVAQHKNQSYGRTKPRGPAPVRWGSSPSRNFRAINCRTFHSGSGILPNPFAVAFSTPVTKKVSTLSPKTPSPASSTSNGVRNTPRTAPISFSGKPIPSPFAVTSYSTPVTKKISTLSPKTPSSSAISTSNGVRNTPRTALISFAGKPIPNPIAVTSYSTSVTKRVSTLSRKTPSSFASSTSNGVRNTPRTAPISFAGKPSRKECVFMEKVPNGSRSLSELWAGPAYSNSPPPSCLPIPKFSLQPKRTASFDLPHSSPEIEIHPIAKSAPPSPTGFRSSSTLDLFGADSATKNLRRILNLNIDDE